MTTSTTENSDSSKPLGLGSSEGLGPLPLHPTARTSPGDSGWTTAEKLAIRDYAAQQVAAERERCAKLAEGAQQLPNDGKDFANGWCSAALQIAQAIRA